MPQLRALAEEQPVVQAELPDGSAAWLVTGFSQARQVVVDPRFSRALAAEEERKYPGLGQLLADSILGMDPPEHIRIRKLVAGAFTARRLAPLRPTVAQIVSELLDAMLAGPRPADLVSGFSLPLPVRVICHLLGVPAADQEEFRIWSDALVSDRDGDFEESTAALDSICAYMAELIEIKRANPGDDLMTTLIAARDGSDRLSENELVRLCVAILVGGYETTANQINLSLLALLAHPAEMAKLRANLDLIPGAIEELMRFVQLTGGIPPARITTEEVQLAGVTIPAGEVVLPIFAAANRDASAFPEPDRLDITRTAGPHLSFGAGAHHCVGAHLARMELQEAFRGMLGRMPGLRLAVPAGELPLKPKLTIFSFYELPVTWDDNEAQV